MNTRQIFTGNDYGKGMKWIVKCFVLSAIVAVGWRSGYLQETCIAVIAAFVVVQGIFPFCRITINRHIDRQKCRDEKEVLQDVEIGEAEKLSSIDASDAGSIFKLISAIETKQRPHE